MSELIYGAVETLDGSINKMSPVTMDAGFGAAGNISEPPGRRPYTGQGAGKISFGRCIRAA